jgi:hypothetical protein
MMLASTGAAGYSDWLAGINYINIRGNSVELGIGKSTIA